MTNEKVKIDDEQCHVVAYRCALQMYEKLKKEGKNEHVSLLAVICLSQVIRGYYNTVDCCTHGCIPLHFPFSLIFIWLDESELRCTHIFNSIFES